MALNKLSGSTPGLIRKIRQAGAELGQSSFELSKFQVDFVTLPFSLCLKSLEPENSKLFRPPHIPLKIFLSICLTLFSTVGGAHL